MSFILTASILFQMSNGGLKKEISDNGYGLYPLLQKLRGHFNLETY